MINLLICINDWLLIFFIPIFEPTYEWHWLKSESVSSNPNCCKEYLEIFLKQMFYNDLKEISSILQSGSLSTFVKIRLKIACRMFPDLSCCFRPAGSAQKFYWSKLLVRWIHVPNHTFQKSKKFCRAKHMSEYIPNFDFKKVIIW